LRRNLKKMVPKPEIAVKRASIPRRKGQEGVSSEAKKPGRGKAMMSAVCEKLADLSDKEFQGKRNPISARAD